MLDDPLPYTQEQVLDTLLPETLVASEESVEVFAPANIALCKYWGKRNDEIHLPNTSSLSISLGKVGTWTRISPSPEGFDELIFNGTHVGLDTPLAHRIFRFVDYFRRKQIIPLVIETRNDLPTAAGLATSASGFAALVKALNEYFALTMSPEQLSICARIGSGSASRSIYDGFVRWNRGTQDDGMDSFAEPIAVDTDYWQQLRIGVVIVDSNEKHLSSREGMFQTVESSILYDAWSMQVTRDLEEIEEALASNDFTRLGQATEHNALSMHATMLSAWPPVMYWQPKTLEIMQRVWELRREGIELYFTIDAGANVKLLFLAQDEPVICEKFDQIELLRPFS